MLVLAIDTSSAAVTAALFEVSDGVQPIAERVTVNARGHGELLAPSIAACLREAQCGPSELDAIVAGVGPGPFTGLRVGLVSAAVFSDLLGIPAFGVCSLDAIVPPAPPGEMLVATDARRKEVYWARYDVTGRRIEGPHVARPADVPVGQALAMAGAGAKLYADVLGLPLVGGDYPDPASLVAVAADRVRAGAPSQPLTPMYLRRPDAVANPSVKRVTQ
ncbi:MAG TPA: tRNA (adenosine(37)-N6)-threonylcarbamoyltransferase complex dimerization subunit type 1 TsaB [Jatrophihabitantaceae bacterium]|nr:tRNA (adenosine(37)-N6)-threonylcarbamoyltransferase complex dimerization subunit type 1 TsaB [Jatrophihabitantaceae bacterium]